MFKQLFSYQYGDLEIRYEINLPSIERNCFKLMSTGSISAIKGEKAFIFLFIAQFNPKSFQWLKYSFKCFSFNGKVILMQSGHVCLFSDRCHTECSILLSCFKC